MSTQTAFFPQGNTYALSVTNSNKTISGGAISTGGSSCYYVANPTTTPVFLAFAASGATAPVAVVPTEGSPGTGLCVPGGATRVFSFSGNAQIAYIAGVAGPNVIYITPGEGL
jgi:hypothetical protein